MKGGSNRLTDHHLLTSGAKRLCCLSRARPSGLITRLSSAIESSVATSPSSSRLRDHAGSRFAKLSKLSESIASPWASLSITGGAGFIGSHTALVLMEQGHSLVVLDSDSSPEALERVRELAEGKGSLELIEGDVRDPRAMDRAFRAARRSTGYSSPSSKPLANPSVTLCGTGT